MSFAIGENVGPYRITDRLGQGGMASVFRAYHANLDRYVALKVLHAAFKEDPTFLARFRREAQIVAKLEHPSIIPIYDYNEHNGEPYLIMKFIEGETLKARLASRPLTLDETLRILTAVGEGLTYAHERGVLHRDIKPSNILLENGVQPYIADFGLARMASAGESTLSQDMMLGTPQYMSPEQAQGVQELDSGADIYSLGVVLYELVVGRVPFNADTPYAIVHDHIFTPLPLPTNVNPQVPRAVEQVLLKALAKERGDRYPSAVALVEAFREAVRVSDLKELSAHTYRVPLPSGVNATASRGASALVGPSISAPIASGAPTASLGSTAQHYAQQRRRNLWVLGGCAGLIGICLMGLFISVSAFNDASIRSSLFDGRPTSPTPVTSRAAIAPTPTLQPDEKPTTRPTGADAAPTPSGSSGGADKAIAAAFGDLSVADAQKLVGEKPDDPMAHFALAAALLRDGKPVLAQQELTAAIRLAKNDPALLFSIGQALSKTVGPDNQTLAVVYAYAYAAGSSRDANIRSVAGEYLYRILRNGRKRDIALYKTMQSAAVENNSAGLYAFLALAYDSAELPDAMREMMDQALKLGESLPEVHLVRGILSRRPLEARRQFEAAWTAPDAPPWLANEARTLAQQKGS